MLDLVVERQPPLLLQPKHRCSGELLGDGPDPVDRVGRGWYFSLEISEAVSIGEHDGSSARDGDREPGNVRLAQRSLRDVVHPGGQVRVDPDGAARRGRRTPLRGAAGALAAKGRPR